jgi:ethanolamine ammonia-lyase small subunit
MSKKVSPKASHDPWRGLTHFTNARIGLGRAGMSQTTQAHLDFQLAHAMARDAVHHPLDFKILQENLKLMGHQSLLLNSQAENQSMYLQRPDLGRLLSTSSKDELKRNIQTAIDATVVVADGLSSKAIEQHAEIFLKLLLPELKSKNYNISPIALVKHGRVAVGDGIAENYKARLCILLIGERPGLSSPDSMGIYFTFQAKLGQTTDADRNCISNIHKNGLSYQQALKKLLYLIAESEKLQLSGVQLKDETTENELIKK